ncbi:MAG: hypothetical protein EOP47_18755 [Sphingobacteriaceae bacterium]|nr:MAG: hypothetical protein EOP47_18755 [Sphingobacteriaceae bacterium]
MEQVKKVAVIIPFYKESLTANELVSVQQCFKVLGSYPVIAVKPQSLALSQQLQKFPFTAIESFSDEYFKSIQGYNRLMLSAEFYGAFTDYEYILIHQPDAFVFRDELADWCNKNIDYVGPPWIRIRNSVNTLHWMQARLQYFWYRYINKKSMGIHGHQALEYRTGNGGFSLRRVKRFQELCTIMALQIEIYNNHTGPQFNEDTFWSIEVKRSGYNFDIPNYKEALKFAFEIAPERARILNHGNLPFGCHAWDINIDYWRPIFANYGYKI